MTGQKTRQLSLDGGVANGHAQGGYVSDGVPHTGSPLEGLSIFFARRDSFNGMRQLRARVVSRPPRLLHRLAACKCA